MKTWGLGSSAGDDDVHKLVEHFLKGVDKIRFPARVNEVYLMGAEGCSKSTFANAVMFNNCPDEADLKQWLQEQGGSEDLGTLYYLQGKDELDKARVILGVELAGMEDMEFNYASKDNFPCPLPTGAWEAGLTVVPTEVFMGPDELSFVWEAVFIDASELLKDIEAVRKHITKSSSSPLDAVTVHRVGSVCNLDLRECFSDRGEPGEEERKEMLSQLAPPKWLRRFLGKRLTWSCRSSDRKKALEVMQFLSLCFTGARATYMLLRAD
eukprot:gene22173-29236_t